MLALLGDRFSKIWLDWFNFLMWKTNSDFWRESWKRSDRAVTRGRPKNALLWIKFGLLDQTHDIDLRQVLPPKSVAEARRCAETKASV